MFVRRPLVCLLSAVLLSGGIGWAGAKPPNLPARADVRCQPAQDKLVQRVYQVADLVIPIDSAAANDAPDTPKTGAAAPCRTTYWAASRTCKAQPQPSGAVCTARIVKSAPTQEDTLIKLITSTIAPQSWSEKGGPGTIDYFPMTMSLVINQTCDVQDQIADLLAALRRLQDQEVAIEVRFATVSDDVFQSLDLAGKAEKARGLTFLTHAQMVSLMETLQADARTSIMQTPKLTAFNGQTAALKVIDPQWFVTGLEVTSHDGQVMMCPKNELIPLGVQMSLRPIIAADRRSVELALNIKQTELASSVVPLVPVTAPITPVRADGDENVKPVVFTQYIQQPKLNKLAVERTLKIPDGQTAVLTGWKKQVEGRCEFGPPLTNKIPYVNRLFRKEGYSSETCHVLVMVTPRIIVTEETEERKPKAASCIPAKSETVPVPPWVVERPGGEEKYRWKDDFRTPVLPPIRKDVPPPPCEEPPDEARILRALPKCENVPGVFEEHRDNIQIVTERIVDKIDPPRYFPLVGPAQLHHCHWKCSVYYTDTIEGSYPFPFRIRRPKVDVVYIDLDHLHRCDK